MRKADGVENEFKWVPLLWKYVLDPPAELTGRRIG